MPLEKEQIMKDNLSTKNNVNNLAEELILKPMVTFLDEVTIGYFYCN